jgi:hypothetical protein
MAVFEPLCQNEKVGCHVPMFVLEHDFHVEKTDVSFACSYLWTPRRAILAPFVNQPRFILRRPSSTFLPSQHENDMSNNLAAIYTHLDGRICPICAIMTRPVRTSGQRRKKNIYKYPTR